jgi:transcriptional regulator with XRE-family HTH domain
MTQEQLAEAADLDARFIQRIERAETNLSVSALVLLADALGVHPSELLRTATLVPSRTGRPKRRDSGLVVVKPREAHHDERAEPEVPARAKNDVR